MTNASLKTRIALKLLKIEKANLDRNWADFEASCDADYKAGYRPSHCFHGINLWTDYDPICGPCEDGLTSKEDHLIGCYYTAIRKAEGYISDMEALKNAYHILLTAKLESMLDIGNTIDLIGDRYGIPKG